MLCCHTTLTTTTYTNTLGVVDGRTKVAMVTLPLSYYCVVVSSSREKKSSLYNHVGLLLCCHTAQPPLL